MNSWKFLKSGDLVDIVAPGSATSLNELNAGIDFLKSWGLRARVREPLFSGHPYVSSDADKRVADLKKALLAKDSQAVWCLRGGYGALQMVPGLLKLKPPQSSNKRSKLLIGYSDISTLHLWLNKVWKWPSCHGPLLDGMAQKKHSEKDSREFCNLLFGVQKQVVFDGLEAMNKAAEKIKRIEAPIMAGNLVVLASSLGSPLALKAKGKILCLEEIGERGYRIDRLLFQLENSGALNGCEAILLGSFLGGDEPGGQNKNYVSMALSQFAERTKIPVYQGLQIGHGTVNRPLFLGVKAKLVRKEKSSPASLIVESGGRE